MTKPNDCEKCGNAKAVEIDTKQVICVVCEPVPPGRWQLPRTIDMKGKSLVIIGREEQ